MSIVGALKELILDFLPVTYVDQNEGGVFLRAGKYRKTVEPGAYFTIPFVDEITTVEVTPQIMDIPDIPVMCEGEPYVISGAVEYFIENPFEYILAVQNADTTLKNRVMAAIVDSTFALNVPELESIVYDKIDIVAHEWGVAVTNFWVTKFAKCKVHVIIGNQDKAVLID